jgi:hypothetical protein
MFYEDIPTRVINGKVADLLESSSGIEKVAASLEGYIRLEERENSFLSGKILTELPIDPSDLTKDEDLDVMKYIVEIEPEWSATWVSFQSTPRSRILKNGSGVIYFGTIATEKVVKNIMELKTRSNDIRKIVHDIQVKEILKQQDGKFIELCRAIVAANPAEQDINLPGGVTKNNFIEATKLLPSMKLKNGCALMNEWTAREFLKWNSDEKGFKWTEEEFQKGMIVDTPYGVKLVVTIKNDAGFLQNNEMFLFSPEDSLGKFLTLEDTKVSMKKEHRFIEWFAWKTIGIGIFNTKSVIRVTFN